MTSIRLSATPSSFCALNKSPSLLNSNYFLLERKIILLKKKKPVDGFICRAEFSQDAPFAAAIGACFLSSLVLPKPTSDDGLSDSNSNSAFDTTDARFTAMGIISFIPYFNWLSWVFAWLDTGKRRYALYALAYLAPYLRSNLSLSPEESWLPVASILLGIIHVQLEASIRNGDLEGFQFFKEAANFLSPMMKKKNKDGNLKRLQELSEEEEREHERLTSGEEHLRNEIRKGGVPREPSKHPEDSHNGWQDEDERNRQ